MGAGPQILRPPSVAFLGSLAGSRIGSKATGIFHSYGDTDVTGGGFMLYSMKLALRFLKKLEINLLKDTVILLLCIYPKDVNTLYPRDCYAMSALFSEAKIRNQPGCIYQVNG